MTTTVSSKASLSRPDTASAFYVTGGTLSVEASSYVERQADHDLLHGLTADDYCYVLNSRQMGKSSLSVRTIERLKEQGRRTCFLDLTKFGGKNLTAEQWYAALLVETGRVLGLRAEMLAFWKANSDLGPMQRLFDAIRQVALPAHSSPLTIFVDEIDVTRSLSFSADEFFAGIRQCYVGRATDPAFNKLTICLLGTATPADLIRDTRVSPFNIGRRIEVKDFTSEEAQPLAQGLGTNGPALLPRVLYWTGGHPYLTQRLCRVAQESGAKSPADIDRLCSDLFLTRTAAEADDNLVFVRNRLLKSEVDLAGLLDLYGQMQRGRRVPDDEADPLCAVLKLSGVARTEGGWLRVRNRIYEHVFSRAWVVEHTPGVELRRQREAYRRGLRRAGAIAVCIVLIVALLALSAFQNAHSAKVAAAAADNQTQIAQGQTQVARVQTQYARRQADLAAQQSRVAQLAQGETKIALVSARRSAEVSSQRADALAVAIRQKQAALRDALAAKADALAEKSVAERNLFVANRNLYVADMNSIQQEWNSNNVNHVASLLQETRNLPERGFEWGYWNRMCHLNLVTLRGHTGTVISAAFSPDGSRIVTAGDDRTARVWDAKTGTELLTLKQHTGGISDAAFSPDGSRIVTANHDNTAHVWDARTGRDLMTLQGHTAIVISAAFSPDGKRIVTSGDKTARVWDARTGRELLTLEEYKGYVVSASFSLDGRRIVTASWDHTARVWETNFQNYH